MKHQVRINEACICKKKKEKVDRRENEREMERKNEEMKKLMNCLKIKK